MKFEVRPVRLGLFAAFALAGLAACTSMPPGAKVKAATAMRAIESRDGAYVQDSPACRSAIGAARQESPSADVLPSVRVAGERLTFLASASGALPQGGVAALGDVVHLTGAEGPGAAAKTQPALKPVALTPVPSSALVSDRAVTIHSSAVDWKRWRFTLFTHPTETDGTLLVALVARSLEVGPGVDHVVWFPQPFGWLNLNVMEQLYRHSFTLEATRTFRFVVAERQEATVGGDGKPVDQAQLLRMLAGTRQCAAAVVQPRPGVTIVPWRLVTIQSERGAADAADSEVVHVRLTDDENRPLARADVTLWRLPHLGCNARTGSGGSAVCRLEDSMGHPEHAGFDSAPIVVTYPGHVAANFVLLPTTHLISR